MATATPTPLPSPETLDQQWFIVGRWQEIQGELRANLLRIMAIGVFYSIELASHYRLPLGWLQLGPTLSDQQHQAITWIAVSWAMLALCIHSMLRQQMFPLWLKYLATIADVVLLTTMLAITHGPRSAMLVGYFLIIVLSALRFQRRLVWCATSCSILAYLFLLAHSKWFVPESLRSEMMVPRFQQVIFIAAILLTGVILSEVVRRAQSMAHDYARRLAERANSS